MGRKIRRDDNDYSRLKYVPPPPLSAEEEEARAAAYRAEKKKREEERIRQASERAVVHHTLSEEKKMEDALTILQEVEWGRIPEVPQLEGILRIARAEKARISARMDAEMRAYHATLNLSRGYSDVGGRDGEGWD